MDVETNDEDDCGDMEERMISNTSLSTACSQQYVTNAYGISKMDFMIEAVFQPRSDCLYCKRMFKDRTEIECPSCGAQREYDYDHPTIIE